MKRSHPKNRTNIVNVLDIPDFMNFKRYTDKYAKISKAFARSRNRFGPSRRTLYWARQKIKLNEKILRLFFT